MNASGVTSSAGVVSCKAVSQPAQSPFPARTWLVAGGILLIVITYANSLTNSFHFDDSHVIENNAYIRSLGNVAAFFTDAHTFSSNPANATYRPLESLTLALDHAIGRGLDPRQFHVTQIVLLIILFFLVAALFRNILEEHDRGDTIAVIAAAWFAVQTVNSETMNLISARSELLAAIGVVGSFVVFTSSSIATRTRLHILPMLAGIFAKATAAIYAPLLFVHVLLFGEPAADEQAASETAANVRRAALISFPAFIAGIAGLLFIARMNAPEWTAGGGNRLLYIQTQAWVTLHYLRLFVLPVGLTADTDQMLIPHWYDTRVIAGVVVIAAIVVAAFRLSRDRMTRPIAFGIFWFVITILPSALYPLAEVANEHRVFVPYVGLALAATCAIDLAARRIAGNPTTARAAVLVLLMTILACNAVGTIVRNRTWRTEESLWLDVTRKSPNNGRALMNYGLTQMAKGNFTAARNSFDRAALLTPNYATLEINQGIVSSALADHADAQRHFRRALELQDSPDSRYFYGRWLIDQGRSVEAIVHLSRAIALSPASMEPRNLLMSVYLAGGDMQRLQQLARETLAIVPSNELAARWSGDHPLLPVGTEAALFQDGVAATRGNRHLDAAVHYRTVVSLDPRHADAWNNLGWELAALGLRAQAIEAYQNTLRIDPRYERAANNLRLLLGQ